jgi:hypothetical protein
MGKPDKDLKLIYVLKVGKNSKGEGVYEFIFSDNPEKIDSEIWELWNWDQSPAIEHKEYSVPDPEYISKVYSLTTNDFCLFCLHDAVDRPYIHGYHLIHALAYEDEEEISEGYASEFTDYEEMFDNDDLPLLVFHYGNSLKDVEDKLYERSIILKGEKFTNTSALTK